MGIIRQQTGFDQKSSIFGSVESLTRWTQYVRLDSNYIDFPNRVHCTVVGGPGRIEFRFCCFLG